MYLSLFLKGFVCERELETEQNCNILSPTLMAISLVSFSFFWCCSTGGPGAQLSAECWLSLPHLVTNGSGLQTGLISKLTDFLSSPSYIIVQSPTQYLLITSYRNVSLPLSLEWHVLLSLSGNNCHAVHRSLSSGASVWLYHGILPCLILSAKPAYANGICNFRVFGMACLARSKVNIQQKGKPKKAQKMVYSLHTSWAVKTCLSQKLKQLTPRNVPLAQIGAGVAERTLYFCLVHNLISPLGLPNIFTQSGWLVLFSPNHLSLQHQKLKKAHKTLPSSEFFSRNRRLIICSWIAAAASCTMRRAI